MNDFVIVHGGGRGSFGPVARLFDLKESLKMYVIEADLDAVGMPGFIAMSGREKKKTGVDISIVPGCLGHLNGSKVLFNVNVGTSSSSVFSRSLFADGFQRESGNGHDLLVWKDVCEPQYQVELETITIDALIADGLVEVPDLISLDIQGSELSALRGAWGALTKKTVCVLAEAEFLPMYEEQPLISDMMHYLWGKGFFLAGFTGREQWYDGTVYGRGFVPVTETIFFKRRNLLTQEQKLVQAYLAGAFEYLGYAHDLCHEIVERDHDFWENYIARGTVLAQLVRDTYVSIHRHLEAAGFPTTH